MRKAIVGTSLMLSLLSGGDSLVHDGENRKVSEDMKNEVSRIITMDNSIIEQTLKEDVVQRELARFKKESEFKRKIGQIREAIEKDIDPKETRVLLIGISKYKFLTAIDASENDVDDINRFFRKNYLISKKNIFVLKNRKATKAHILKYLSEISEMTPQDKKIIVYFSGHGIALDKDNMPTENFTNSDYTGYISPYEADFKYSKKDKKKNIFNPKTRISQKEINDTLKPNQQALLIIDACFGGALIKDIRRKDILISGSDKEVALGIDNKSLFSSTVFNRKSRKHKYSIGETVTNSKERLNTIMTENGSPQQPIIKTESLTLYMRDNSIKDNN
ncbi:MAG: caspase family protein [Candidatus Gracilibacteria bacterium]|nr:caspase family protein [Candidatus Gracilibacteria bacterium]